jgi:hypothetical protein
MIELTIDDQPGLFLAVTDDERIRRSGSGYLNPDEKDLFSGPSDEPVCARIAAAIKAEWLEESLLYELPDPQGQLCVLTLQFDGEQIGTKVIRFKYGSESIGVPPEFREFVRLAVSLTESWYQNWRRSVRSQARRESLKRLARSFVPRKKRDKPEHGA